jgi:hypothetical protein
MSWQISGSYFESCNCDPICPCRRIDGVPGGRSTHGVCMGVLSWMIDDGASDDVDLAGIAVAMAVRYSDDEEGSPWSWFLYIDDGATQVQHEAIAAIFSGDRGGEALTHFPWAWKRSERLGVRAARIEVRHEPRRQWLRVGEQVTVRIRDRYDGPETVTCVIPGHDRSGEELVTETLHVDDGELAFDFEGVCGYATTFAYSG